jgi:Ca2+ transporting ATPase
MFHYEYENNIPFFTKDPITGNFMPTQKAEHFTLIFNTFIFMQIFNEINSRKIGIKEYNVFEGILKNYLFIGIIIGTMVVQIILV